MSEIEVGQTVYLENTDHRRAGPVQLTPYTVVKLGRKWATLSGWSKQKFEIDKSRGGFRWVHAGDYAPSHRVWLSPEEHADFLTRNETWRALCNLWTGGPPDHLSNEQLLSILQQIKGPKA